LVVDERVTDSKYNYISRMPIHTSYLIRWCHSDSFSTYQIGSEPGREAKPAVVKCLPLAFKRSWEGSGFNGDEIENKLPCRIAP
jgi:hypothetical protein